MTPIQRVFAIAASLVTLLTVIELIRRRKLREEYALLWILTSGVMLLMSSWYGLVERVTRLIGAVTVTTTLFLFGIIFLLLISVHFSTVLSRLTSQVQRIAQELAIAQADREGPPRAPGAPAGQDAARSDGGVA